jgi:hypothetical protein
MYLLTFKGFRFWRERGWGERGGGEREGVEREGEVAIKNPGNDAGLS